MKLVQSYLTKNPCYTANIKKSDSRYTDFQKSGPKGLMLHSVGCPQPRASVFINLWNSSSYSNACVHAFIDGNDGTVYQCLPWNFRGWHGGGSSNNTHVGVEMCEPSCIKYTTGSSFTCSDYAAAREVAKRTYESAVELFALICKEYKLDPLTAICSHKEGYAKGIATNHGDPEHLWKGLGLSYTMDGFRKAVYNKLNNKEEKDNMTKEEVKAIVEEVLRGEGSTVPKWAEEEMNEAKELGITDGSRPLGYATRNEVAIMVKRAVKGEKPLNHIWSFVLGKIKDAFGIK